MKTTTLFIFLFLLQYPSFSQTVLEANGPGNTYELINSVFAPNGGDVVETPDCAHPEFGRHISESWDVVLNKYVFDFHIHVTPDNDRCINFDRQRLEIKTYDASPEHLKIVPGEIAEYKWKFKLPVGFQVSSSFTHLHQIKPVGGDESTPTFALTARKGTPDKLELSYYPTTSIGLQKLASANLSLFVGQWVEATERFKAGITGGTYYIEIKNMATGNVILTYQNNNISTFRADNQFLRPKWGVYRSLNTPEDLRDEVVHFADFSVQEILKTATGVVNQHKDFSLLPNPADQSTTLRLYAENEGYSNLLVTGIGGSAYIEKTIFLTQGLNRISLDLNNFVAGTYLVSVNSANLRMSGKLLLGIE